jgi:hypothetical protein
MDFWFEFLNNHMNWKTIICHDCPGFKWQNINIYQILTVFLCGLISFLARWIVIAPGNEFFLVWLFIFFVINIIFLWARCWVCVIILKVVTLLYDWMLWRLFVDCIWVLVQGIWVDTHHNHNYIHEQNIVKICLQ